MARTKSATNRKITNGKSNDDIVNYWPSERKTKGAKAHTKFASLDGEQGEIKFCKTR